MKIVIIPSLLFAVLIDACQNSCSNGRRYYLEYEGDSVDIRSPFNLCHDIDCQWTVVAPIGDVVQVSFDTFDLGYQDTVQIFDGSSIYANSLQKCLGMDLRWCDTTTSTSNDITLNFHTENGTRYHSFSATAYAKNDFLGTGAVVGICIGVMTLVLLVLIFSVLIRVRRNRQYYNNRVMSTAMALPPTNVVGYTSGPRGYSNVSMPMYVIPPLPTYAEATSSDGNRTQPQQPPKLY